MPAKNSNPSTINKQSSLSINPDLVWDYDVPPEGEQSEAFHRWYVARVLTRGRAEDLKAIGFDTIYYYFPSLNLPPEIRRFWDWYFSLPEVRQRYGNFDSSPTPNPAGHQPDRSES